MLFCLINIINKSDYLIKGELKTLAQKHKEWGIMLKDKYLVLILIFLVLSILSAPIQAKQLSEEEAKNILTSSDKFKVYIESENRRWKRKTGNNLDYSFNFKDVDLVDDDMYWINVKNNNGDPNVRTSVSLINFIVDSNTGELFFYSNMEGILIPISELHIQKTETVFRELAWEDCLEFLEEEKGFELVRREDKEVKEMEENYFGLKVYQKENENLELGSLKLWEIKYYFFENKLTRIVLIFDFDDYDHAERMLETRYGKGNSSIGFLTNSVEWTYKKTNITLHRAVRFDNSAASITFESKKMMTKYEKWLEEYKQEKAAEDAKTW